MAVKKAQEIELDITGMAFGGQGIAKVDGFAVFVDKAVPGDHVLAKIMRKKKNFATARVLEMINPSHDRVDGKCDYNGYCGGCKWQSLDYEKQLEYKRMHVEESLEHIGLIKGVEVLDVVRTENIFGYRNKMEFTFSDMRWLLPAEMEVEGVEKGFALGLHVPGAYNKVLDIEECFLHPESGNAITDLVREYAKNSNAPVYNLKSHKGFWRFLMMRHSAAYDQWMINFVTASEDAKTIMPLAELLMEKFPGRIASIVNNVTARKAGVAVGEYEVPVLGDNFIMDKIGDFEFRISANSFFQTNTKGAQRLYEIAGEYAQLKDDEVLIDLFCGTGTIGIFLSKQAEEVIGVEIVENAIADANVNKKINNADNCHFICGDIKDELAGINESLKGKKKVLILDPPRAGIHKDAVKDILSLDPDRIVYVSCNPATMARDLALLKDRYTPVQVTPVDMFPHTFHIESVAKLVKN